MKDPVLIQVGERIRTLRKTKGYTQESFAYASNLERANYGKYERGERNISVLNLVKIADTLGVEISELFPSMKALKQNID